MIVYLENKSYYTIKKLILHGGHIGFFQRGYPTIVIKNWKLLLGLFWDKNKARNNNIISRLIFDDRLVRKQALLHYKKADFTKWPYWLFFKEGTPRSWSKIGNYSMDCFGTKISLEIIFDDRLVTKQALLHYKKAYFTKWLYWLFFKGGTPRQEPIKWSLHLPYKPLESTLSRVDL